MSDTKKSNVPTLYAWAGGQASLENLFDVFYRNVLQDELLAPVFSNMSPGHARHVAHFVGEVFRGPALYTQQDQGSHAHMVAHHLGKMLDNAKRKRWMDILLQTADDIGLPDDPEFRSAFIAYLEWGSRLAVINSNTSENPIKEDEPMPQWGWGETGGPYMPSNS